MGSILDYEQCEHCGTGLVSVEIRYKSGEYTRVCKRCGMYQSEQLKRNEDGSVWVNPDPDAPEDQRWDYEHEQLEGFGAYSFWSKDSGIGQFGPLEKLDNPLEDWVKVFDMTKLEEGIDESKSYITVFVDGEVVQVWGGGRPDEYPEEGDESSEPEMQGV